MKNNQSHSKKGGRREGAGRKTGSKNTKTQQWEQFSQYCMNGGLEKFERELNKLQGKDYVIAFSNLLEFHKPRLSRTTLTGDASKPVTVNYIPVGNRTGNK